MLDLLPSPWDAAFEELLGSCRSSLVITSPYVSRGPCDRIVARLRSRRSPVILHLLTDLSPDNLLSGGTDPSAVLAMVEALPAVSVRFLPRLHAKVYISDSKQAVVTSGNLTEGGLRRNFEYGVRITDPSTVGRIREEILGLAELGSPVSTDDLRTMAVAVADLRMAHRAAEASWRADLKKEFENRLGDLNEDLIRVRVGDRSLDAVLSDTIMFLLRRGPQATPELHREVQRIHPDLCDDTIDRVIKGQHYGKKWKHAVRRAQYHLKQKGLITLNGRLWSITG